MATRKPAPAALTDLRAEFIATATRAEPGAERVALAFVGWEAHRLGTPAELVAALGSAYETAKAAPAAAPRAPGGIVAAGFVAGSPTDRSRRMMRWYAAALAYTPPAEPETPAPEPVAEDPDVFGSTTAKVAGLLILLLILLAFKWMGYIIGGGAAAITGATGG